jgi:hypothetical protein
MAGTRLNESAPRAAESTKRHEELVELVHRLAHAVLHARREDSIADFLRGTQAARHQMRLAVVLVERDRDDDLGVPRFVPEAVGSKICV